MTFNPGLQNGDTITNRKLCEIFKCGTQGGMRRSNSTNTLVLISDPTKPIYEDRWIGNVFFYTGMGRIGDQEIDFSQNRTLAQSPSSDIEIFLFEVFEKAKYTFRGSVKLTDEPYQENQFDINGDLRQVYIFPLSLKNEKASPPLSASFINTKEEQKEKEAARLTDEELKKRAVHVNKTVGERQISTQIYERNPFVAEWAKRRAAGICQLCKNPAPFKDKKGRPYLETHHIQWLSEGGEDTIENTVALCPNCHRKMHSLNYKEDLQKLKITAAPE